MYKIHKNMYGKNTINFQNKLSNGSFVVNNNKSQEH